MRLHALALFACLAACSEPPAPPVDDSPVRPAGVKLCYSPLAGQLPAVRDFWTVFLANDTAARPAALAALDAAAKSHPGEEAVALLSGLGNLWRVAEPTASEAQDQAGFITAALAAKNEVERAYQLCPTDHRIPAWLGPILVNMGRQLGDQATVDRGLSVLQQGIDHYPSFVLFSKLLVYADRPAQDPDFQQALSAVQANIGACGDILTTRDPACRNSEHAIHNVEGAAVFLGDVFAKAGRRADALQIYQDAKAGRDFASWPYRNLLDQRISRSQERSGGGRVELAEPVLLVPPALKLTRAPAGKPRP
jgi:hypothetical protein